MATRRRRLDEANLLRATYSGNKDAIDKARKQIVDRQHSRNTYMGLNNGQHGKGKKGEKCCNSGKK